jgi:hypothetical protein
VKDFLDRWGDQFRKQNSIVLREPITVVGERDRHLGPRWEFARVQLTVHPSHTLEVIDNVAERSELERLGVGWPDCAVFGLLDVLMVSEYGPLYQVRVILEAAWYHDVDSSWQAFRNAGRGAGRKILQSLHRQGS